MEQSFTILIFFAVVTAVAMVMAALGNLFGPKRPHPEKLSTYECGVLPRAEGELEEEQVPIKYATVALIFIIFDVETAFFIPWAVLFREQIRNGEAVAAILVIGFFMLMLLLGLLYAYKRKVFVWDR